MEKTERKICVELTPEQLDIVRALSDKAGESLDDTIRSIMADGFREAEKPVYDIEDVNAHLSITVAIVTLALEGSFGIGDLDNPRKNKVEYALMAIQDRLTEAIAHIDKLIAKKYSASS